MGSSDETHGEDGTSDAGGSTDGSVARHLRTRLPSGFSTRLAAVERDTAAVLVLSFVLFVGFSWYLSLRYATFNLTGSDFGSYVHMFATTLADAGWLEQGKYIASHPGGSYWGGHFSLTLLAFLPFFALVGSPITLVVCKSFALAASVVVLWTFARRRLESRRFALLLTLSYGLNPFLWSAWLFDFQEQVLLPALLFTTYYAYVNADRSTVWYALFLPLLGLVLLTNEFVTILVAGFLVGAAVAAYREGDLVRRLPLLVGGVIATVAVRVFSGWVIGHFSTLSGIPPASIAAPIRPFVDGSYATVGQLVGILITHPSVVVETLATNGFTKVVFAAMLFVPVLFLALRDEITLGALAPYFVFAWLFTGRATYYTFGAHYPLYLLPFVYIGAVRVLARMERTDALVNEADASRAASSLRARLSSDDGADGTRLTAAGTVVARLLAVVVVVSAVSSTAVVADKNGAFATPDGHDELRRVAFDVVPTGASVVTQNDLFPHVATRPNATYIPTATTFENYRQRYGLPTPEYIVYDTTEGWSTVVVDQYADRLGDQYGVRAYQDGIWVWKRGYNGSATGITERQPSVSQYSLDEFGTIGGEHRTDRIVGSNVPAGRSYWNGPYTILPSGTYTVTFDLNVTAADPNGTAVLLDVAAGENHNRLVRKTVDSTDGFERVSLSLTLNATRRNVEFRGFSTTSDARVALRSVTVNRTADAGGDGA